MKLPNAQLRNLICVVTGHWPEILHIRSCAKRLACQGVRGCPSKVGYLGCVIFLKHLQKYIVKQVRLL